MLFDSQLTLLGDEHIGRELMDKRKIAVLNPKKMSEKVSAAWRAMISVRGVTIQNAFQQYELAFYQRVFGSKLIKEFRSIGIVVTPGLFGQI